MTYKTKYVLGWRNAISQMLPKKARLLLINFLRYYMEDLMLVLLWDTEFWLKEDATKIT